MNPKVENILVPVDFSAITSRVMDYAIFLAELVAASVTVTHVVHVPQLIEPSTWMDPVISPTVEQDLRRQLRGGAEQKLQALKERCVAAGINASICLREGLPYAEILKCADEQHADLIVMGSQGRTALSHFLLGSTAERVVRGSRLSVLCVKPGDGPP